MYAFVNESEERFAINQHFSFSNHPQFSLVPRMQLRSSLNYLCRLQSSTTIALGGNPNGSLGCPPLSRDDWTVDVLSTIYAPQIVDD